MTRDKLLSLDSGKCPVEALRGYAAAHKCMSCGKCVFGYEGASQLSMCLSDITMKKARPGDMDKLRRLCSLMLSQSLCEDGEELGGTALAVFDKYGAEFDAHCAKKSCKAGACRAFVTYHILADRCVGCGDCIDACDDDAIIGKKRFVHVIVQDECVKCGSCVDSCDESAIITAGAVKPRCPAKPVPCTAH